MTAEVGRDERAVADAPRRVCDLDGEYLSLGDLADEYASGVAYRL